MWCDTAWLKFIPLRWRHKDVHFSSLFSRRFYDWHSVALSKTHACWPAVCVVETWLRWADLWITCSFVSFHLNDVQAQCCSLGSSLCSCFLLISFSVVFCSLLLSMLKYLCNVILTSALFLDWKLLFSSRGKKNIHGNDLQVSVG